MVIILDVPIFKKFRYIFVYLKLTAPGHHGLIGHLVH